MEHSSPKNIKVAVFFCDGKAKILTLNKSISYMLLKCTYFFLSEGSETEKTPGGFYVIRLATSPRSMGTKYTSCVPCPAYDDNPAPTLSGAMGN